MTPHLINRETARLQRIKRVKIDRPKSESVTKAMRIDSTIKRVCQALDVPFSEITGSSRKKEIMPPRFILAHELSKLNLTLIEITRIMGRVNHSTASYYLKQYHGLKSVGDKELMRELDKLR